METEILNHKVRAITQIFNVLQDDVQQDIKNNVPISVKYNVVATYMYDQTRKKFINRMLLSFVMWFTRMEENDIKEYWKNNNMSRKNVEYIFNYVSMKIFNEDTVSFLKLYGAYLSEGTMTNIEKLIEKFYDIKSIDIRI